MIPARLDTLRDVDAFVSRYPEREPVSDEPAYYQSLRLYGPGEHDGLRPSWHATVYGGQRSVPYRPDQRREGGRQLPAPTLTGLDANEARFLPKASHMQAAHCETVNEIRRLYGLDILPSSGVSEAARGRAERIRRKRVSGRLAAISETA